MKRIIDLLAVAGTVLILVTNSGIAAVPTILHYQGVLTDGGGTPITTNTSVTFTLWSQPAAGLVRWAETRSITPNTDGRFSVLLGQAVPLHDSVFKMPPLYLGVKVEADPELTPRSLLATGAFAFRVSTVDGAAGGSISGNTEIFVTDPEDGLGVRDPGGNIGSMSSTLAVFSDMNGDTTTQIGQSGIQMIDPGTTDTIFNFNSSTRSLSIGSGSAAHGAPSLSVGTDDTSSGVGSAAIGDGNVTTAPNSFAFGAGNRATGENSMAVGIGNLASGNNAIALGNMNIADTLDATVTGGRLNIADAFGATVGGGLNNRSSGEGAVVAGGQSNLAEVSNSTVGGGTGNSAIHDGSTVGGGGGNTVSGVYSTIAGGEVNTASGWWASIIGGSENLASGFFSTVAGGANNAATEYWSFAAGRHARAQHVGAFVWGDSYDTDVISSASDQFTVRASGGVRFFTDAFLSTGVTLAPGGGSWATVSDRNTKENVELVNAEVVLNKLSRVPIAEWNYIAQDDAIRHIGPMAQDFYSAFGVGEDDKHITTIDADGVALAAIQALHAQNLELRELIESQQQEIVELKKMFSRK